MRPYMSVRVSFDNSDYDKVCDRYGGGPSRLDAWLDLGDLLAHRASWHFDVVNQGQALWGLGLLGESRLNIHVEENGRYTCYDHAEDTSTAVAAIPLVEAWLSTREDEAKKPSELLIALAQADDWAMLKRYPHELRVTWSDDYYSVSLAHLNDASFGSTLDEAVNGAAEMLCRLFGAPADLAPQLTIKLELDETATARLREHG